MKKSGSEAGKRVMGTRYLAAEKQPAEPAGLMTGGEIGRAAARTPDPAS